MMISPNRGEGKWKFLARAAAAAGVLGFGKSFREIGIRFGSGSEEGRDLSGRCMEDEHRQVDRDLQFASEFDAAPEDRRAAMVSAARGRVSDCLLGELQESLRPES